MALNRPVSEPKTESESQILVGKFDTVLSRIKDVSERLSELRARSVSIPPSDQGQVPKAVWDGSLSGSLNRLVSECSEQLDSIQDDLSAIERFI